MQKKIIIVGAGPAGSYSAYLLAKEGYSVDVYEEHKVAGEPVSCAGIVSSLFSRIIKNESFVKNKITTARIFSPNNGFAEVKFKEPNIIIDRARFDRYLMRLAERAGANYFLGHSFIGCDAKKATARFSAGGRISTARASLIIGADGPASQVAKSALIYGKRKFFLGIQKRIELENKNIVEFQFQKNGFSWVVPESGSMARVGVASIPNTANDYFQKFFMKFHGSKELENNAGLIPIFKPGVRTSIGKVRLIGDAATMVKATTGGGIIQSLTAAKALAKSVIENKNYDIEWRKKLWPELLISLWMRQTMDSLEHDQYNQMIKLCQDPKIKKILGEIERDQPSRLLMKLLVTKPAAAFEGLKILLS